ncbi:MAG: hypothetical protein RR543_01080 [Erysipelotrichales bacterium]
MNVREYAKENCNTLKRDLVRIYEFHPVFNLKEVYVELVKISYCLKSEQPRAEVSDVFRGITLCNGNEEISTLSNILRH